MVGRVEASLARVVLAHHWSAPVSADTVSAKAGPRQGVWSSTRSAARVWLLGACGRRAATAVRGVAVATVVGRRSFEPVLYAVSWVLVGVLLFGRVPGFGG